jgi:hypothetical protein
MNVLRLKTAQDRYEQTIVQTKGSAAYYDRVASFSPKGTIVHTMEWDDSVRVVAAPLLERYSLKRTTSRFEGVNWVSLRESARRIKLSDASGISDDHRSTVWQVLDRLMSACTSAICIEHDGTRVYAEVGEDE